MNEFRTPQITEINFIPVRPQKGLIGFVSFIYRNEFYLGNISVFTRLSQNGHPTYRISYPEDRIRKRSFFHPINKKTQQFIEREVSNYIEELLSKSERPTSKGGPDVK